MWNYCKCNDGILSIMLNDYGDFFMYSKALVFPRLLINEMDVAWKERLKDASFFPQVYEIIPRSYLEVKNLHFLLSLIMLHLIFFYRKHCKKSSWYVVEVSLSNPSSFSLSSMLFNQDIVTNEDDIVFGAISLRARKKLSSLNVLSKPI